MTCEDGTSSQQPAGRRRYKVKKPPIPRRLFSCAEVVSACFADGDVTVLRVDFDLGTATTNLAGGVAVAPL